jgi:hypothetical protein
MFLQNILVVFPLETPAWTSQRFMQTFMSSETPAWTSVGGPTPGLMGGQPAPPRAPSPLASLLSARNRASPPSMCVAAGEPELSSLVVGQPIAGPPRVGASPTPCKISQGLLQASPARAASRAGSRHWCRRGAGGTCWGSRCEC